MNRHARLAIPAAVILTTLCGCGVGLSPGPSATASIQPPPASPTAASTSAHPADVTIAITIADGKVSPSVATVHVKLGQTVLLVATSDVEESIHVHGYDKTLHVSPGGSAQVSFVADQGGLFEIETHETAKLVVKLQVS